MKIGTAEEIYKPPYIFSDEKISHVIRLLVRMTKCINGEALSAAIETAIKRYPYFAIRAEIQGNAFVNVANDQPIIVREGIRPIALLSAESNYHALAFQYEDQTIALDIAHSITDGRGILPLLKTVLYYYLTCATGDQISSEGINLADSPMFEDELGDPREKIDFSKIEGPLTHPTVVKNHFRIRELNLQNVGTKVVHLMQINEEEFMKFAKSSDGSPAVAMGALFTKIFWRLSDTDKPISVKIACDHRPALQNKHSYRSLSNLLSVIYQPKQKDWTFDRLCTCGRGAVILQSDEQNILFAEKMGLIVEEKLRQIPSIGMLHSVVQGKIAESLDSSTFNISYPGRAGMDSFSPHIENLFCLTDDLIDGGMGIEILANNGNFELALMQGFDDDCILEEFKSLLEEENISYSYLSKETMKLSTAVPEIN